MKKIVTTAVVLIAVLLVAPWGIGQLAEKRVNAGLDKLNETAPYLTITERKWTRGWFRSEQEVTFEVFGPLLRSMTANALLGEVKKATEASEGAGADASAEPSVEQPPAEKPLDEEKADQPLIPPLRFTVRNEILHGPLLWPVSLGLARVNSKLVLSDAIRKQIMDVFGTDEPLRVSTRIGFFGGGTTRLSGDGHTIKFKDKPGSLTYDDYKLDIGYSRNLDDLDFDGSWPRIEGGDPSKGEKLLIKGMTLTSRSERVRGDLYDGQFKFLVDEVRITGADKSETSIENVRYAGASKTDGDFRGLTFTIGSGKVRNPQLAQLKFDLDEIHYDFSLQRLHAPTIEKLVAAMKKVYTEPVSDVDAMNQAFSGPFKQYGMELLKYDPEFVIDRIGIVTPQGEGVIKGVVRLKGVTSADLETGSMGLIGKIDADVTISVDQKLVETLPNGNTGAGAAIDGGYARRDGDKIVSHIEFRKGELKINGKVQGIPGLGAPPAAAEMAPSDGPEPAPGAMKLPAPQE